MKTNKVLVLGSTGMLGWMVKKYLASYSNFYVTGTSKLQNDRSNSIYFDAKAEDPFDKLDGHFDYAINCIGIIKPHCRDNDADGVQNAIKVNSDFPWKLSHWSKHKGVKIIQIATDCVFSGSIGKYKETDLHDPLDVYGKTKSLGEVFDNPNFLNIRCSIIGPELKSHLSLLDWFRSQPENAQLTGFTNHYWNGVTTLQFAHLCTKIIELDRFQRLRSESHLHHFIPNETVNKFQLLKIFSDVFNKKIQITPSDSKGPKIDRTLDSIKNSISEFYQKEGLAQSLLELREFTKGLISNDF